MALVPIKPSQVSLAYNSGADVDIDNDVLVVGSNASSGQVAKLSPAQLRDAIIPVAGQRYWNVDPGPGFGDEYSYTDDAVLTAAQDGAAINNAGAAKAIEITLLPAISGAEISITRIADFDIVVKPYGSETIQSGAPGGTFTINNRGTMVLACRADGGWEIVIEPLASAIGVVNLRSFGNNGAALYAACVSLQDYETLLIPADSYDLSDHTTGFPITANNCHITSLGTPVLDFGGYTGVLLTGGDQNDVTVSNIHLKNFANTALGVPIDGTQEQFTKQRITIHDCKITDASSAAAPLYAINLKAITKQCKVYNNHIESLVSTATASNPHVYGIYLGLKCDNATREPDPSEEYAYGYDGADILTAEGSNFVSGNTIRKLRGAGSGASDAVTGLLVDGWRCVVIGNIVEDVVYTGSYTPHVSGVGIYARGFSHIVSNNTVTDCSYSYIEYKDGSTSATFGPFGGGLISANTMRGNAVTGKYGIVLNNGYTKIDGNNFDRINVSGAGALIYEGGGRRNVEVTNNTFNTCSGAYMVYLSGSRSLIANNNCYNPQGPLSANRYASWYVSTAAAAEDVRIINNRTVIDDTSFDANAYTSYARGVIVEPAAVLYGLEVSGNSLTGYGSASASKSIALVAVNIAVDTHENWIIENNWTDAAWRDIADYLVISFFGGATAYPAGFVRKSRFPGWLSVSAASTITLVADESGAEFANVGAAAGWSYVLPAATPGLEFGFVKTVAQAMTVTPNGSEVINAGSGGGALTLTNIGSSVHLKCFVAGLWIVTQSNGTYTVA